MRLTLSVFVFMVMVIFGCQDVQQSQNQSETEITAAAPIPPEIVYDSIVIGTEASDLEKYAAKELQRYIYALSGKLLKITKTAESSNAFFVLGQRNTNAMIDQLCANNAISVGPQDPGPQGYLLKKLDNNGQELIVIAGSDAEGVLYGVYGLLDDYYGVGFYLGGDILPDKKDFYLPDVDEKKAPQMVIRGFLPWTNFPQSATVYSWEDWKFIIDQAAKMRMNFIHIHNYNFGPKNVGHNEMFHNFEYKGYLSRVWMATARTGHMWGGPGWDVNKYRFGAADLFDDYDFGADCTLHNETLNNHEVFAKGVSMFQKVIDYAHRRGVKIGLGLDIDLIPHEYQQQVGAKADDPNVIAARLEQLTGDYPNLDYLLCFHSESPQEDKTLWQRIFKGFYDGYKAKGLDTRLAVAGWGLPAAFVADLPEDVICAPISGYSDRCETGEIYGDREYWGCPWLERDFRSSQYYYPYDMHLSNTIDAYEKRAPNMKGFYCLTWRLTDAVDAKMSYIAKAPWDLANQYTTSRDVYHEYAEIHYGPENADAITAIIDQNEPFASDFGECQHTPDFTGSIRTSGGGYILNISRFKFYSDDPNSIVSVNAVDYVKNSGTQKADCSEGGKCLGYIKSGDWVQYEDVNFGNGINVFEARVATATRGGEIDLHLNTIEGPIIGTLAVNSTGGWQSWQSHTLTINDVNGVYDLFLRFYGPSIDETPKAVKQLAVVDQCIEKTDHPLYKEQLNYLRCRLQATKDHIELEHNFPHMQWDDLPGAFESWAKNFMYRVTDISSLGNVQSSQNRFVQFHFVNKEKTTRAGQKVKSPSNVRGRGTKTGAVITWTNEEKNARGFHIYRDGKQLNTGLVGLDVLHYEDTIDGEHTYTVACVSRKTGKSKDSIPVTCLAGSADDEKPFIVVISPPVSVRKGQPIEIKARILDNRTYDLISAKLYYRSIGDDSWQHMYMKRRTKAVFTANLNSDNFGNGIEYYIEANDSDNTGVWPAKGAESPATTIIIEDEKSVSFSPSISLNVRNQIISWHCDDANIHWYRIYRSKDGDFEPNAANFLCYVDKMTTTFKDNGFGYNGELLNGAWHYRVTAVDFNGNESLPSHVVTVQW